MKDIDYSALDKFIYSTGKLINNTSIDKCKILIEDFEKDLESQNTSEKERYRANFYRLILDREDIINNVNYSFDILLAIINNVETLKVNNIFVYKIVIDAYILGAIVASQINKSKESEELFDKAIKFGEEHNGYSKDNYYDALNCAYTWKAYFYLSKREYSKAKLLYNKVVTNYEEVKDDPNYFVKEKQSVDTSKAYLEKLKDV